MSKEAIALQYDLFSGELVDARSQSQKKKDSERTIPQQMQMFKTPDIVQFGNQTHSGYKAWLDQATPPALALEIQDVRTPEEIERDLVREAQKHSRPLFEIDDQPSDPEATEHPVPDGASLPSSAVIFEAQTHCCPMGLRAKLRSQRISACVRLRFQ